MPDSGVSDHGESEVQMNKFTNENERAGACGTTGDQRLREAEEIAEGIDRMVGEGGKDPPQQLSLKD
jgi:hypothetical protein